MDLVRPAILMDAHSLSPQTSDGVLSVETSVSRHRNEKRRRRERRPRAREERKTDRLGQVWPVRCTDI